MGSIHDQAMQYIYQQVLQRLLEHLSQAQRASLQLLIQRLIVAAGGLERIKGLRLMFVFDGSQYGAQALACLRAAQLSVAARSPGTFQLRIATARQAGMSSTALSNIENTFSVLFMHDDPRVELLVLDAGQLLTFDSRRPPSACQQQAERHEWLMLGHLSGRAPTAANFASHGYLHLVELGRQTLRWKGGVDAIISADPLPDRRRYLAWSRRSLRDADLLGVRPIHSCAASLLDAMGGWRRHYLSWLLGQEQQSLPVADSDCCGPVLRFITVDDLVFDRDTPHGERLSEFLGYRVDEQAYPSHPFGIANPLLLAHLQGLQAEFVEDGQYREGIERYLCQTRQLMQRKGLPDALQRAVLGRWRPGETREQRRKEADAFAQQAYGLSEAQLVCQLFGPFVARGRRLEAFLRRCHPGMLVALPYLHQALQGQPAPGPVKQWLADISGLPLPMLHVLYGRELPAPLLAGLLVRGADLRHQPSGGMLRGRSAGRG
ncbi:hypothetical protein M2D63_025305 [Pseudomonas sp. BJa5]|uniref:hypothetical protein n=1 Tax=Pseudomonas sp. BJa5 TaxID=2936270 RepID=UPI0025599BFE|nr:hypothetical protein [Pseudomonas sp. BGr12]MDL2424436.1 hypothetical protein [Pseudomonas sp. BGr12]